jgi:hypothetical protein
MPVNSPLDLAAPAGATNPIPRADDAVGWEIYNDEINREMQDEISLEDEAPDFRDGF